MARRNRTETPPSPALESAPTLQPIPYRRRPLLLAAAALLFAGWVGWLAFLVATARPPIVLSHPQMLAATVDVLADIEDLEKPVHVVEVLWPDNFPGRNEMVGKELTLGNLSYCGADWTGPGRYLVPLRHPEGKADAWIVAPTAPSPGYPPPEDGKHKPVGPPRIYPATPSVLAQRAQIRS